MNYKIKSAHPLEGYKECWEKKVLKLATISYFELIIYAIKEFFIFFLSFLFIDTYFMYGLLYPVCQLGNYNLNISRMFMIIIILFTIIAVLFSIYDIYKTCTIKNKILSLLNINADYDSLKNEINKLFHYYSTEMVRDCIGLYSYRELDKND